MTTLLTRPAVRTWTVALRLLALAVLATLVSTGIVLAVGAVALPAQASGSLVTAGGRVVGSDLLGQRFTGRQWFQPRPSASDYDAGASGGSNLGPDSAALRTTILERRAAYLALNGAGTVPADAVTASASGLDPDISVANALRQADRVAAARDLPVAEVRRLIARATTSSPLTEPSVRVLRLNLAVAAAARG